MARIRSIKPEFWSDEKLGPRSPLTRLVFLGLISQADDSGRLFDSVKTLDGLLFPYTDDSCSQALNELAALGRVLRYADTSGRRLIQIVGWAVHQYVKNPSVYVLPAPSAEDWSRVGGESEPPKWVVGSPIPIVGSDAPDGATSERKAKKRKAALPSDWLPNEGHHSQAKRDGLNVESEAEQFRDHHTAKGSVMLDWNAAFRTWLRNAVKFQRKPFTQASEGIAVTPRQVEEWQAMRQAAKAHEASELERLTKAATVRNGSPSTAKEPSGPLAGVLARVVGNTLPPEAA
jgi:hypothetical protein